MFWRRQLQFPIPLLDLCCGARPLAFAGLFHSWTFVETISERRVTRGRNLATLALPLEQQKDRLFRLLLKCLVVLSDERLDQRLRTFIKSRSPIASAFHLGEKTDEPIAVGGQSLPPLGAPPSYCPARGFFLPISPADDGVATIP